MENSVPGLSLEAKEPLLTCTHSQDSLLRPPRGGKSWAGILFIIHIIGFMFLAGFVHDEVTSNSSIKSVSDIAEKEHASSRMILDETREDREPSKITFDGKESDPSSTIIDDIRKDREKSNIPYLDSFVPPNIEAAKVFFYGFGWSMAFSIILAYLLMLSMYSMPAVIIRASIIAEIGQFALLAIIAIYFGYSWTGRFFCFFAYICVTFYTRERRSVPFSAAVLKNTISVLKKHPAMILVNSCCIFPCVLYGTAVLQTLDSLFTLYKMEKPNVIYFAIYSGFTIYWSQVFMWKFVHFIITNVYATDFYSSISNRKVRNPSFKSLKRALTTSFGRICYESLIPRFGGFNITREWDSPLNNRAAKSSTSMVLHLICLTVGSSVYLLVARYFNLPKDLSVRYALMLGILSSVVPFIALHIIETGYEVILRCFAEDPQAFLKSKDGFYNKIADAYHQVLA